MSEKYKKDGNGLYFVSFSVVGWIDVFIRREYQEILIQSLQYCQKNKNLKLYCYCIMPSHVHFITYSENGELSNTLRDLKSFTAKLLLKAIADDPQESRKQWMMYQFEYFGRRSPQKQDRQFWQHNNHAFFLYSNPMIKQKVDYIHFNPVVAGFVNQPHEWRMSSACEQGVVVVDEM